MSYRRGINPPMFITAVKADAILRQSIKDRADHPKETEMFDWLKKFLHGKTVHEDHAVHYPLNFTHDSYFIHGKKCYQFLRAGTAKDQADALAKCKDPTYAKEIKREDVKGL